LLTFKNKFNNTMSDQFNLFFINTIYLFYFKKKTKTFLPEAYILLKFDK